MKTTNIKFIGYAIINGEIKSHRTFCTETAKNNWANRCYNRFGEEVKVDIHDFNTFELIETWSA